mgnify:CR=1 FL=1
MSVRVSITVNGRRFDKDIEPRQLLVHFIRDLGGFTGTKIGCDHAECGNCTIMIDDVATYSCSTLTMTARGRKIVTIEGLSANNDHPAQQAWVANQVPQCGYCQSGMIMACAGAMNAGHHGTEILSEMNQKTAAETIPEISAVSALVRRRKPPGLPIWRG